MIKFRGKTEDGHLVGLGLSEENVKRLKEGKPILFNLKELGLQLIDENLDVGEGIVTIMYGETEELIAKDMKENFKMKL